MIHDPCACEERHDIDCPVLEQEAKYWASYFGLRSGTDTATKEHNRRQLEAFAPVKAVAR